MIWTFLNEHSNLKNRYIISLVNSFFVFREVLGLQENWAESTEFQYNIIFLKPKTTNAFARQSTVNSVSKVATNDPRRGEGASLCCPSH